MVRDDDYPWEPNLGVGGYFPRLVAVNCGVCGSSRPAVVGDDVLRRAVLRARGHAVHRPWTGLKIFGWVCLAGMLAAWTSGEPRNPSATFYVIAGEWIPQWQLHMWVGRVLLPLCLAAAIRTWEGRNLEPCPSCGKPRAQYAVLAPAGLFEKDSLYERYGGLVRNVAWWIVLLLFFAAVQR